MRNIVLIAIHEWRLQSRRKLAILLLGIFQILLIASLFNGWSYTKNMDNYQTHFQDLVNQQWAAQPDRHPHRVAHFGTYGFRPANTLGLFDSGVNHLLGNTLFLEAHRQNASQFSETQSGGNIVGFIPVSTANLLLMLWPLLLVVLAQDAMSQEVRSKRFALLQTTGVKLPELLLGKSLAYLTLSVLFLLPTFALTALLAQYLPAQSDTDLAVRLAALFACYLLYSFWWVVFILMVSTLIKNSMTNLSLLVASWLLFCLILPKLLASYAYHDVDIPSQALFEKQLIEATQKIGNSHNPNDPYFSNFKQQVLQQYNKESVEELPVNYAGLVMAEGEKLTSHVFDQHYQKILDHYQQQNRWLSLGMLLSPYVLVKEWSMKICATDSRHFYYFEKQAEKYRYNLIQELNHLHTEKVDYKTNKTQRLDQEHWQMLPSFSYQPPDFKWSIQAPWFEKWILVWWLILVVVGLILVKYKGSQYAAS